MKANTLYNVSNQCVACVSILEMFIIKISSKITFPTKTTLYTIDKRSDSNWFKFTKITVITNKHYVIPSGIE